MPRRSRPGLPTGVLRGLNPERDIIVADTATTIESTSDDEVEAKPPRRTTRVSRCGDRTPVNYDMGFHPMDVVTRPNSHVTKRHVSTSISPFDNDSDTSSASSLSDAIDVDSDEASEDELASDEPEYQVFPRTPDPRAVRQSSRAEAKKVVNYSRKYHPQDIAIPGFQHKARQMALLAPTPPATGKSRKRKSAPAADETDPEPRRPRKHLRSLDPNVQTAKKVQPSGKKRGRPPKPRKAPVEDQDDEVSELVEFALSAMQRPRSASTRSPASSEPQGGMVLIYRERTTEEPYVPSSTHGSRAADDDVDNNAVNLFDDPALQRTIPDSQDMSSDDLASYLEDVKTGKVTTLPSERDTNTVKGLTMADGQDADPDEALEVDQPIQEIQSTQQNQLSQVDKSIQEKEPAQGLGLAEQDELEENETTEDIPAGEKPTEDQPAQSDGIARNSADQQHSSKENESVRPHQDAPAVDSPLDYLWGILTVPSQSRRSSNDSEPQRLQVDDEQHSRGLHHERSEFEEQLDITEQSSSDDLDEIYPPSTA